LCAKINFIKKNIAAKVNILRSDLDKLNEKAAEEIDKNKKQLIK